MDQPPCGTRGQIKSSTTERKRRDRILSNLLDVEMDAIHTHCPTLRGQIMPTVIVALDGDGKDMHCHCTLSL